MKTALGRLVMIQTMRRANPIARPSNTMKEGKFKMGKVKTHKASAKRFSVTGTGKVKINHCHHRHNLGKKTSKRKRHLRMGAILSDAMTANIRTLIQK